MRKMFFMAMLCAVGMSAAAQDELETTMGADVVSNYVWRGQDLGSVSLQPMLGVGWRGLSFAGWGNVGLSDPDDSKEIDLTLGYTIGGLNIGITDYWVSKDGLDPQGRYFKYDAHGTNHVFEANIGYDFGFASLQWFTNFSGNDYKDDGKRAYSSYVEATVPFKLGAVDWTATAGAVPAATDYYGTTGFAVTNLSLKAAKDIKVTDAFSIPVFAQFVGNPCSQKAYLVFGLTLQP